MKKHVVFVFFMLGLLSFWQWVFFELKEYFSGSRELQVENSRLKVSVDRERAKTDLTAYKFELFRQNVAKIIPTVNELKVKEESVRSLASVVQNESPEFLRAAEVESKIRVIKDHFADRKYKLVVQSTNELLASDPVTPELVTLYFMLTESYFQLHELGQCVQVSQKMMKLFPENEKTGMAMLRVGMLLKEKNRSQEAKETWLIVSSAYQSKELKDQAQKLIASLEHGQ
jgi:hypothetical protein